MAKISFDVKFLNYFVSSKIAGCPDYEQSFDLSHIPALERRRLSTLAKCIFAKLPEDLSNECKIIFASYTGEMNRCLSLLKELTTSDLISPTSFSLTVLNSAPALLAISQRNFSGITAISSNLAFEMALISAVAKLENEAFVIIYDELIGENKEPQDYAFLALQICPGDSYCLEFSPIKQSDIKPKKSYVDFLNALRKNIKSYEFDSNSMHYKWNFK